MASATLNSADHWSHRLSLHSPWCTGLTDCPFRTASPSGRPVIPVIHSPPIHGLPDFHGDFFSYWLRDLNGADATARIAFRGEHVGEGPEFCQAADQHGLEGIVSKRADSRYVSGRATSWLKVKSFTVGDFAVVGVERSLTGIPVALLATLGRDPAYVGDAMVTLKAKERDQFWRSVATMGTPRARLAGLAKNKKATWVREGVVDRVRHLRGEEKLRHATMQSLDVGGPIKDDVVDRHPGDE